MSSQLIHILITRPSGQEKNLVEHCEALGLSVRHLPCIDIKPIQVPDIELDKILQADCVLFTSQNAVVHAHSLKPFPWPDLQIHAIGRTTADALHTLGQDVHLQPEEPYNSESYLRQLNIVDTQRLVIVKGEGGRQLIQQQLSGAGWSVQTIDVYKRSLPCMDKNVITNCLQNPVPDIISITSNESLTNLQSLAQEYWPSLLGASLVVNSQRAKSLAESLGFTSRIEVASPAGDEGQVRAISRLLNP